MMTSHLDTPWHIVNRGTSARDLRLMNSVFELRLVYRIGVVRIPEMHQLEKAP